MDQARREFRDTVNLQRQALMAKANQAPTVEGELPRENGGCHRAGTWKKGTVPFSGDEMWQKPRGVRPLFQARMSASFVSPVMIRPTNERAATVDM